LSLSCGFGLLSGSFASAAVRRSGESGDVTWLVRVELKSSDVTVCALAAVPDSAISARHGKAARKARARLFRPNAGLAITSGNTPTKTNA
jgi:phage head maturation protease